MDRRDFLDPRRFAHLSAELLDAAENLRSLDDGSDAPNTTLLQFSRRAMATSFEISLPFDAEQAAEAAGEALDEIDRLEDRLSIYRENSMVCRLNRMAADRAVRLDAELLDLLTLARNLHADTAGAFDVTTGALSKAWGFYRREGRVPSQAERVRVLQKTGMNKVVLDADAMTVRFLRKGLEINLGSIGKGYALDRAAQLLRGKWGVRSAIFHGGHSSVYALGSQPGVRDGWPVGIRHPWQPERRLAIVRLRNRGLGTSAATFQHLQYNGRVLGHILDPRTGWPSEGMAAATAVAPSAALADALATAFFILGVEGAREYCRAHREVGAIVLPAGENEQPVICNLSHDDITLLPS